MQDHASTSPLQLHEQVLVALLRRRGALSRAAIARALGRSKGMVGDLVGELIERGVLTEIETPDGDGVRSVGRPGTRVTLAAAARPIGVLALTHARMHAAIGRADGSVLAEASTEAEVYRASADIADVGAPLLDEALTAAGLRLDDLACVMLGLPLPLRRVDGAAVPVLPRPQPDLDHPLLVGVFRGDPTSALRSRLALPLYVENDGNLAALGEATLGAGRGMDGILYFKIAEGLGAGVVLGGRLWQGATGLAGEIAHVRIRDDGPLCVCGGRGCLATLMHGPSLLNLIRPAYGEGLTFGDVIELARTGDAGICRILGDLGRALGRLVADVSIVLNLDGIVLDGLLDAAAEPIAAGIRETVERRAPRFVSEPIELRTGTLGVRADVTGGLVLAGRRYLDELLPTPIVSEAVASPWA